MKPASAEPVNGRAITRPMRNGSQSRRAIRQVSYRRSRPKLSSCAAIWNTLSAEV
jgi:hypothetical protein